MTRKRLALLVLVASGPTAFAVWPGFSSSQDDRPPAGPQAKAKAGGGPGFGGPGGFGPGLFLGPRVMELADLDEDGRISLKEAADAASAFIREADTDKKGSIDSATLIQAMNRKVGPPPGFGPGGPGGPGGGFGPGNFIGPQILAAADANKDGRLSPEEAAKAAESFIRDADSAKKGSIDGETLVQVMNRRIGPPPGFGPGGRGGPMAEDRKLVKQFDKDGNGRLGKEERSAARAFLKKERETGGPGGGRPGFGPPPGGMFGGGDEKGTPGPKVAKTDAAAFPGKPLYDSTVLRTLFLDFEDEDWEAEMADFNNTDIDMPATLTIDGKKYPNVGVHYRGLSSFFMVRAGSKRSLNVSLDFVDPGARFDGYKTLNLLNSHEDPTFLHTVLYFDVARRYTAAPKANYVKVVINGESWGVYVNAQQFDKKMIAEAFPSGGGEGTRWKVKGSPGGGGGLDYLGDDVELYKKRYQIKTKESVEAWKALVNLCKTLSETPPDRLEAALKPILDIEGTLWFLALDNALINGDGYWIRASDYSIYRDPKGLFHIIPHDANETFQGASGPGFGGPGGGPGFMGGMMGRRGNATKGVGGPGGPGGTPKGAGGLGGPGDAPKGAGGPGARRPGGSGLEIDPLIGLDDPSKPLRSKLLAVPALRARYLDHVGMIANEWLDWEKLKPVVETYRALIDSEIKADTRKLSSYEDFHKAVGVETKANPAEARGRPVSSLRDFAEARRKYLLGKLKVEKTVP